MYLDTRTTSACELWVQ